MEVIGSQIRDNPESGDHDRRRSKEEEEERRRSKIGKPTSWQHSRCMQGGVQLVAHRKLRCARSNQGSLVAPHVQHQEQELHSNERKGTQSFLTKGVGAPQNEDDRMYLGLEIIIEATVWHQCFSLEGRKYTTWFKVPACWVSLEDWIYGRVKTIIALSVVFISVFLTKITK